MTIMTSTTMTSTRVERTMTEPVGPTARRGVPSNLAATTGSPARPRRRHPALKSRIVSTGISAAAMFGIVAALGVQEARTPKVQELPASVPQSEIVVDPASAAPTAVVVSELSDRPVQLTATPVVRAAPPAPSPVAAAPVARTNGSR